MTDTVERIFALSPDVRYVALMRHGGLDYVVIRYGNFFQVVRPVPGGPVSVSVEPRGDPLAIAAALERALPAG